MAAIGSSYEAEAAKEPGPIFSYLKGIADPFSKYWRDGLYGETLVSG
jgi:hypothetical protein